MLFSHVFDGLHIMAHKTAMRVWLVEEGNKFDIKLVAKSLQCYNMFSFYIPLLYQVIMGRDRGG